MATFDPRPGKDGCHQRCLDYNRGRCASCCAGRYISSGIWWLGRSQLEKTAPAPRPLAE